MFLASTPAITQADIFKFQDNDGRIYYSPEKRSDSYTLHIKTGEVKEQPIKKPHKKKSPERAPDKVTVTPIEEKKPDNRTPIEQYQSSHLLVLLCRQLYINASLTGEKSDFARFDKCFSENEVAFKEKLKKALETVNNPKAQQALKDYHIVIMTALKSITTGINESAINYEQRQQVFEARITEAWERFEIER